MADYFVQCNCSNLDQCPQGKSGARTMCMLPAVVAGPQTVKAIPVEVDIVVDWAQLLDAQILADMEVWRNEFHSRYLPPISGTGPYATRAGAFRSNQVYDR